MKPKLNFSMAGLQCIGVSNTSKVDLIFYKTIYLCMWINIAFVSSLSFAGECFESQALTTLNPGATQGTLVYVWSPRMVLSAQHAAEVQHQASAVGLHWLPVHDAQVPQGERLAALAKLAHLYPASSQALQNSQPLCDAELIARDALRHFPTAFVWRDALQGVRLPARGWSGNPIVGAMPAPFWASALRERLLP